MPYNMQLMMLKAEESENFYRDQMIEKEKEMSSFNRKCQTLELKCEEAYEVQHDMENALEEYEVNTRKWEEQIKNTNRKFQDLQRKHSSLIKEKRELNNKVAKLELDKCKLSEKWIKLSSKNKTDDKVRQKLKESEAVNDKKTNELSSLTDKLNKNERENAMFRKANDSLQTTINQHIKQIKFLKSNTRDNQDEMEITDQITSELVQKIEDYEAMIEELKNENMGLAEDLESRVDQSEQITQYENILQQMENNANDEVNRKLIQSKEDSLIRESENMRLKEKNEKMQKEIINFKQEFDSLQEYISLKEDHIRNKFKDEEVWVCIQMLLKELISVNKKQALNFLGIDKEVSKQDITNIIKSNFLQDSYVRFVIVNCVAYLQEWKESLNYLKQKYAESELKYDNIIEKYQTCRNEKTILQNNTVIMENNLHSLVEENQALTDEKQQMITSWTQDQSQINPSSFVNSYDANILQHELRNNKENYSQYIFRNEESVSHINDSRLPLSTRLCRNNQMSVDQSQLLSQRMSQNLSVNNKNASIVSNRVSWDGLIKSDLNSRRSNNATKLCNKKKSYASASSISFYKPQNTLKRFNREKNNNSAVSVKSNSISHQSDIVKSSRIQDKRRQLIKSIEKIPEKSKRNSSRSAKHRHKNDQHRSESQTSQRATFGVSKNSMVKHSYIDMRMNTNPN